MRSTLVLCKNLPEYSQLADETYFNLKFIYIRTNSFFGFSFCFVFGNFFA